MDEKTLDMSYIYDSEKLNTPHKVKNISLYSQSWTQVNFLSKFWFLPMVLSEFLLVVNEMSLLLIVQYPLGTRNNPFSLFDMGLETRLPNMFY